MEMDQSSGQELPFLLSEVVWAKVTGFPWWPAVVTSTPSQLNTSFRVDFFADSTHAFVTRGKIVKYSSIRREIDLHKHMKKGLRKAIAAADHVFHQNRTLPLARNLPSCEVEPSHPIQKQLSELQPIKSKVLQENHQGEKANRREEVDTPCEMPREAGRNLANWGSQIEKEEYVCFLLEKYQLSNFQSLEEAALPHQPRQGKANRKKISRGSAKAKKLTKILEITPSFVPMLSRRLHKMLKSKQQLSQPQKQLISLNLSKQIQAHHHLQLETSVEQIAKLFTWIELTPCATIAAFYQSWSTFQAQKEKASNMTTQE